MAIAGSTANVFSILRHPDGSLVVTGPHRIAGHLVEDDEQKIKQGLHNGSMVHVAAYGVTKPQLIKKYNKALNGDGDE